MRHSTGAVVHYERRLRRPCGKSNQTDSRKARQGARPPEQGRETQQRRKEKRKQKDERRATAKSQRAANPRPGDGEDPDIAGITPGPQPNPWGDDEEI